MLSSVPRPPSCCGLTCLSWICLTLSALAASLWGGDKGQQSSSKAAAQWA